VHYVSIDKINASIRIQRILKVEIRIRMWILTIFVTLLPRFDLQYVCWDVKPYSVYLTCSDILITETETKTRMIDFSFTETKTNTEKILKTETI